MKILFFASLKEQVNCSELELDIANEQVTVAEVKNRLIGRGEPWASALSSPKLLSAVNQEMAGPQTTLSNEDELAFFPPVTGG